MIYTWFPSKGKHTLETNCYVSLPRSGTVSLRGIPTRELHHREPPLGSSLQPLLQDFSTIISSMFCGVLLNSNSRFKIFPASEFLVLTKNLAGRGDVNQRVRWCSVSEGILILIKPLMRSCDLYSYQIK